MVLLAEVDPRWMVAVRQRLGEQYPYIHDASQRGHFGIALLSRVPLESAQTNRLGTRGYPSIEATVRWQGEMVTLYGAHPHPPLGAWGTARRNSEMREIREIVAATSGPLVLMGDLNAAPWSSTMEQLFDATTLRHAAVGFGIRPTWWLGSVLVGLPYDHILVSPEWGVAEYAIGPAVGSDHFPVVAELVLR